MATEQGKARVARKPTKAKIQARAPWMPPEWEIPDAAAIKALEHGTATEDQQRRALDWIIREACRTYDQTYYPGPEGERDSDFAQGKRSVGLNIISLLHVDLTSVRKRQERRKT